MFKNDDNAKWSLKDLAIRKEEMSEVCFRYFLSATYEVETLDGIFKVNIPNIILPISSYPDITMAMASNHGYEIDSTINLGFGKLLLDDRRGPSGVKFYTIEKIKDKVHEMTLDEIEKKLGYKVKIVNKED